MEKKKKLKAAALKYSKENLEVPVLAALGSGKFAREIIEEAKKNRIKIVENKDFFEFEELFNIGEDIPVEVYKIVVEILSCIINTNKGLSYGKKNTN